jgi:DNA-binding transcriptional LysR family regulator
LDIKRSDLPLLISLDALLDERNVTKAARRLNISQSTLSGQLGRLRQVFGDPLLVPSANGRGMVPTERALELQSRLGEALSTLRDAVADKGHFDPATSTRTFVIAANDNVFTIAGLSVIRSVAEQNNPNLRVAVMPATDATLAERMARGEVDLFLGDVNKVPESLKVRTLMSDTFRMAQRLDHPRGLTPPTLDEYCALSHVIVSQRAEFRTFVDDVLADLSRSRRITLAVPSYNQIALVLGQTDCVATLPRRLLERYASLIDVLDLPFEVPPFVFAMAWHPRSQDDKALQWLRTLFLEAVGIDHP